MSIDYKTVRVEWRTSYEWIQNNKDSGGDEFQEIRNHFESLERSNPHVRYNFTSYVLVYRQMRKLSMTGWPYIDVRTYDLWKLCGRYVLNGEKSKLYGVSWRKVDNIRKRTIDSDGSPEVEVISNPKIWIPKVYFLFHVDQTEATDGFGSGRMIGGEL